MRAGCLPSRSIRNTTFRGAATTLRSPRGRVEKGRCGHHPVGGARTHRSEQDAPAVKPSTRINVITYALLAAAGAVPMLMPNSITSARLVTWHPTATMQRTELTLVVRDFSRDHPDFNVVPDAGYGAVAGCVQPTLGADGHPVPTMAAWRVTTPWRNAVGAPVPPHLYDAPSREGCLASEGGEAGKGGGATDNGITSRESFAQWFRDVPGVNESCERTIRLRRTGAGVWEFVDDAFHPIDGRLLGNEGDRHNSFFTVSFDAELTYRACVGQYITFAGDDDAWMYIDGKLAMDRGGMLVESEQVVELDRLGLEDGQTYRVSFFVAQRQLHRAAFRLRTNVKLDQPEIVAVAAAPAQADG